MNGDGAMIVETETPCTNCGVPVPRREILTAVAEDSIVHIVETAWCANCGTEQPA